MTSDPDLNSEDVQNDEAIGRALKGSLIVLVGVLVLAGGGWMAVQLMQPKGEQEKESEIVLPKERELAKVEIPAIPFVDITESAGIDWTHVSGMEGEKLLPETMGGGVAIFDFDQDGDQDLLFVGGATWDWSKSPNKNPRSLCLYKNDGDANFTDATNEAGLDASFYGMGPAIADVDNDGWPDLFVSAVGSNRFYRNVEGKFKDATEEYGLAGAKDGWSTGATWFDYDKDGLLDLFVCDYVIWNRELDLSLGFKLTGVGRAYGQPTLFTGTHSHLYHNEGGHFSDVTAEMGIEIANPNTKVPVGKGLGVAAIDVDQDGWQDILVANDTVQNFLFLNLEGKEFAESGTSMGVAFDRNGNATGAMGVDCGYLRNDESLAVAIGNFANEQSSLYTTRGPYPPFEDQALVTGLGPMSRLNLTFGMCFADLDLDSRLDLFCSNGHLEEEIAKVQSTQQYEQPPQFFWNAGLGGASEFVALGEEQLGSDALKAMVGRGAAFGDLDGDHDLDVVFVANSGKPRLLRNDQTLDNDWIRLSLVGTDSNHDALGAILKVQFGNVTQTRVVTSTRSYLSQCELPLTFGFGAVETDAKEAKIQVTWPSGLKEEVVLPINETHELVEGVAGA